MPLEYINKEAMAKNIDIGTVGWNNTKSTGPPKLNMSIILCALSANPSPPVKYNLLL